MSLLGRFLGVRAPQPPRTTDRAVAFTLCAETFIRRDWESALAQAAALGVEHKSLQILQIMLLSLQRIPVSMANPDYKLVWQDAVDSIPGTRGFDAVLLGVTLGQVTLDQALSTAKDDRERCKAYYYAGAQLLNQGKLEEAAAVLASAASIEDGGWERQFATAESARAAELSREKPVAPTDTAAVKSAADVLRAATAKIQSNPKSAN